jgi:cytochrome P450
MNWSANQTAEGSIAYVSLVSQCNPKDDMTLCPWQSPQQKAQSTSPGEPSMVTSVNNPVPAGFDALPVLDLRNPDFTVEGNRLLAELRAKGPICRVEPLGALGFLRWADCDAILRDFRTFSAAFEHSQPVPGAEEETKIDTLLREDPPKHTRVRALMQQAFTPQRVAAMEPTRRISPRS